MCYIYSNKNIGDVTHKIPLDQFTTIGLFY